MTKDYDQDFITELKVDMQNRQGALAELTNVISKTGSNIHGLSTEERWLSVHSDRGTDHQRSFILLDYEENSCNAKRTEGKTQKALKRLCAK